MATLYLIEQNRILRKRGERLLLCRRPPASRRYSAVLQKDIILDLPAADVDHIMVFGNVQVTVSAYHLMLRRGVEMAIFSYSGELLGQLTPPMGKNIPLRIMQFQRYQEPDFSLNIARKIVEAKIHNALMLLRSFLSNHPEVFTEPELQFFRESQLQAQEAPDMSVLLGIEGAAGAHYFSLFQRMINPPWRFTGRNKRPPEDPVNAVLSFGYVVSGAQIRSLLDGMGFDPYLGFYHQPRYGRPALALDILEEFRHPLVDRLCLTLFNKGILKEKDFWQHPSGGIYLNTDGKRKFFREYQEMVGKPSALPESEIGGGFYALFQRQVERMANTLKDDTPYQPFVSGE